MAKLIDITGRVFGKWTVLAHKEIRGTAHYWLCKCECGNTAIVRGTSLMRGKSKSCGCTREALRRKGITKHGGYGTRLYRIWDDMKARCYNPKAISYPKYGAKGITICEEWHDFSSFRAWALANGYNDTLSIDRIDNNKNYSPANCKWSSTKEQANNRSTSKFITYNNETLTLKQWAEKLNISYGLIWQRLKYGWTFEKAITTQSKRKRR